MCSMGGWSGRGGVCFVNRLCEFASILICGDW